MSDPNRPRPVVDTVDPFFSFLDIDGNVVESIGLGEISMLAAPEKCPRCGASNTRGAAFCKCGFDIQHGREGRPRAGKCWFCGKYAKLTNEHAIPKWLIKEMPQGAKYTHKLTRPSVFGGYGEAIGGRGSQHMKGLAAASVKNSCHKCNNGWMSRLQVDAMPIVRNMMNDGVVNLSEAQRLIIARWSAMIVSSLEYINIVHISQEHRQCLPQGEMPPWVVSLADSDNDMSGSHFLRASTSRSDDGIIMIVGNHAECVEKIDSAFISFGSFTVHVVATTANVPEPVYDRLKRNNLFTNNNLMPIWPENVPDYKYRRVMNEKSRHKAQDEILKALN